MKNDIYRRTLKKQRNVADMASGGHFEVPASPARFWSAKMYVPDYRFVEDDCEDLVECAKSRLMYGQRLCHHRRHPFDDEMAELIIKARQAKFPHRIERHGGSVHRSSP